MRTLFFRFAYWYSRFPKTAAETLKYAVPGLTVCCYRDAELYYEFRNASHGKAASEANYDLTNVKQVVQKLRKELNMESVLLDIIVSPQGNVGLKSNNKNNIDIDGENMISCGYAPCPLVLPGKNVLWINAEAVRMSNSMLADPFETWKFVVAHELAHGALLHAHNRELRTVIGSSMLFMVLWLSAGLLHNVTGAAVRGTPLGRVATGFAMLLRVIGVVKLPGGAVDTIPLKWQAEIEADTLAGQVLGGRFIENGKAWIRDKQQRHLRMKNKTYRHSRWSKFQLVDPDMVLDNGDMRADAWNVTHPPLSVRLANLESLRTNPTRVRRDDFVNSVLSPYKSPYVSSDKDKKDEEQEVWEKITALSDGRTAEEYIHRTYDRRTGREGRFVWRGKKK